MIMFLGQWLVLWLYRIAYGATYPRPHGARVRGDCIGYARTGRCSGAVSVCVCVAVGCLTGVGQSDVGQPMPPVPAALLLLLPRLPRLVLLRGVHTRCACC